MFEILLFTVLGYIAGMIYVIATGKISLRDIFLETFSRFLSSDKQEAVRGMLASEKKEALKKEIRRIFEIKYIRGERNDRKKPKN